ncbi:MAG: hypothetical protein FGM54_09940 [Chitinophagaceae bacterium]|nr:hypothetical protein [Chitinophagaceae bacterium]
MIKSWMYAVGMLGLFSLTYACSSNEAGSQEKNPQVLMGNFYLKNQTRINDSMTKATLCLHWHDKHLIISDSISSGLGELPTTDWAELKIPTNAIAAATLFGESDDYIYAQDDAGKIHVYMGKTVQGKTEEVVEAVYEEIFAEK